MGDVLVPFCNCIVVLNNDGQRVLAKYFDNRSDDEQAKAENAFHKKTKHNKYIHDCDVILCDGEVVTYRTGSDCKFFISSTADENELVLAGVLDAIFDTLSLLFSGQMDHRTILDNLELVLLTIDEVIDHGHIMEMDPVAVQNRVIMRASETSGGQQQVGDLSISEALNMYKDQFKGFMKTQQNLDGY
eukprot:GSChrysophyteH1.ASY1.ANO1.2011.1 assembled CDS